MATVYGFDPIDTLLITSLGTIPEATHLVRATSGAVYAWERDGTNFIIYRCTISNGVLTTTEVDRVTDAPDIADGGTESALALGTAIYFFIGSAYYKFEANAITEMGVGAVENPAQKNGYLGTDGTYLFWMSADTGDDTEIRTYNTATGLWYSVGLTGQPLEVATSEGVAMGGKCYWPVIYEPGAPNDEADIVEYSYGNSTATRHTIATGISTNNISRLCKFNNYLYLIHTNPSNEVTLSKFDGVTPTAECTFGYLAADYPDYTIFTTSTMFVAENASGNTYLWLVGEYFGDLAVYSSFILDTTVFDPIANLAGTAYSGAVAVVL